MKLYERLLLAAFIILFMLWFAACKSVQKTQYAKSETTAVKKSDSSSVKTYTVVDTTKTDSSFEITETTFSVDSIDWHAGIPDIPQGYSNTGFSYDLTDMYLDYVANNRHVKAKAMKVSIKTIKQAAIIPKGQT